MGGMVTIFDPQGNKGEIPYDRLVDAVKAGAKPAVTIKAPDGTLGDIPADRMQDAVKAGATIVPFKDQETQHPGFWAMAKSYMGGILHPSGFSPYPGMDQEAKSAAAAQSQEQDQARKAAGYNLPYRVAAAAVPMANAPAMEESARQGDVGGVLGTAAAGMATAAAPLAVEGAVRGANAGVDAIKAGMDTPAGAAVNAAVKKLPVAAIQRIPYIGKVLKDVYLEGAKAYREAHAPTGPPAEVLDKPAPTPSPAPAETPAPAPESAPATTPAQESAPLGKRAQAKVMKQAQALGPNAQAQQQAAALKQPVIDIVDKAIPPTENRAANLRLQSEVDFHLTHGDVEGAQQALNEAAPSFSPPINRGTTSDIRAQQPEAVAARRADSLEDQGIQQQMSQNLEAHGKLAEADARKEFIARNSTGTMKEELVRGAGGKMEGPTRYVGDEPVTPKRVVAPDPIDKVQSFIDDEAQLMKKAGASAKAIQQMRNARMNAWMEQNRAFRGQSARQ